MKLDWSLLPPDVQLAERHYCETRIAQLTEELEGWWRHIPNHGIGRKMIEECVTEIAQLKYELNELIQSSK